jgi:hypothetical protein
MRSGIQGRETIKVDVYAPFPTPILIPKSHSMGAE